MMPSSGVVFITDFTKIGQYVQEKCIHINTACTALREAFSSSGNH